MENYEMTPDDIASTWFDLGQPARSPVNPIWRFGGKDARIRVVPVVRKKKQSDPNGLYIFCCIRGDEDERTLSPMYLGPCGLYENFTAKKVENAWQYSKVYPQHVGADGNPNAEYFRWARQGWSSPCAVRYPMGKENDGTEGYHWWDGQRLGKIDARKRIYVTLYAEKVVQEPYFQWLKNVWEEVIKPEPKGTLYLMDFDAYEYGTMSFSQVLNNPAKSMGHGFVLAMLLTNDAALQECELHHNYEK
jgi:hypothetical protein